MFFSYFIKLQSHQLSLWTFLTCRNKLKGILCLLVFKEHSQCYFLLCVWCIHKTLTLKVGKVFGGLIVFSITAGCILWALLFSIPHCPSLWLYFLLHISGVWDLAGDHGLVVGQVQMYANSQRIYNFIYVAYYNSTYYFIISLWGRWNR